MDTVDDDRATAEQFIELVLSDPDLFELAFASVEASWSLGPPSHPIDSTHNRQPGGPSVQVYPRHVTCRRDQTDPTSRPFHWARSPPQVTG
jgi:hypothetical protein